METLSIPTILVYYLLILEPLVLVLVVLFVFVSSKKLFAQIKWLRTGRDEVIKDEKLAQHFLSEAEGKAAEILRDAQDQAEQILRDSTLISKDLSPRLERAVAASIELLESEQRKAILHFTDSLQKEANQFSIYLKNEASQQIITIAKTIAQSMSEIESELLASSKQSKEQVEIQLSSYQKRKEDELAEKMVGIAKEAAMLILGRTMMLDDQKEVVLKALEDAKRNHVL